MPKIIIDKKEIEFENGMTIMQACELGGFEIPKFCYHDKLSIAGNCRMCLVEMEKSPKPIASCAMPAGDGMIIKTNTDLVKKARKGVMEFLLINHPLDCPICDQGGECDLQDQALHYGFDKSRYDENKRAVQNKHMGPLVSTIMTRCIHCTRCVRFSTEVAGVDDLGLLGRGENAEITTYLEKTIKSEMSGNVIDLCPVGALTSKPYAFKARPWELKRTESIDIFDALGSSVRIDSKGKSVFRILPRLNDEINEEWINDKSRFAIDGLSKQRIDKTYIRKNNKLELSDWDITLKSIVNEIKKRNPKNTIALSSQLTDIETLYSAKKFLNSIGSNFFDCRFDNAQIIENCRSSYIFNSSINEIDNSDSILIVGSNPRWEASVLNTRIRKAYLNNDCKINLIGPKIDLTYEYEHLSEDIDHLNKIYEGESKFCETLKKSNNSKIIIGTSAINSDDGQDVLKLCFNIAKKYKIINNEHNGLNILQQNISRVGALDIGFYHKAFNKNFKLSIKEQVEKNKPVVFLLGLDDINLEFLKDAFVVFIGHHGDNAASIADIVLPCPAFPEKSSTFVNTEGRVMQTTKCFNPIGEAKDEWKIFRALNDQFNKNIEYNNLQELRNEITDKFSFLRELYILPQQKIVDIDDAKIVKKRKINYNISNFYMTDSISRASINMANCTKQILNRTSK